ncbi:MAG: flavodoxin family protein [Anaerovibrio sp.]|nr:flavodoxin family protein [Anaerovibrio sp.]
MKAIVIYSTLTGNTQKIAEAIAGALPMGTPCTSIENMPEELDSYDLVFAGYWVDKGGPDAKSKELLGKLTNPHVALFATLGAYPDSDHAKKSLDNGAEALRYPDREAGRFICQGKVDPKLVEAMSKQFPQGHPHGMNPERIKRLKDASVHPDEQDCDRAQAFARDVLHRLEGK